MNFSKKNHELVGQNEQNVKRSQKHDVNLQKNSTLYFQVGLILTLLATYGLFEMQFQTQQVEVIERPFDPGVDVYINYVPEDIPKPIAAKKVEPIRKKLLAINLKPIEDDLPVNEATEELFKELVVTTPDLNLVDLEVYKPEEPIDKIFSVVGVEQVPIYPGCEGLSTNDERRQCMSAKIGKLISRKFDTDLAGELGLTGMQRIYVQFKIDKTGKVTDVKAKATHSRLEREAKKVINKIPQMIPGKQRDKNVAVMYSVPIRLQVQY